MFVRVAAIRARGPVPGDDLLDPEVILRWVRAALVCDPAEAVRRADAWRQVVARGGEPSIREAILLRRMKKRLGVAKLLREILSLPPDLEGWLEHRDQLVYSNAEHECAPDHAPHVTTSDEPILTGSRARRRRASPVHHSHHAPGFQPGVEG